MLYLNIGDKEMAEKQFGVYHTGEDMSLKTMSAKLFVMVFSPLAFCHAGVGCDLSQGTAKCWQIHSTRQAVHQQMFHVI